jgi:hypothetical protein
LVDQKKNLQLEAVREELAGLMSAREAVEAILKMKPEIQRQVIYRAIRF